MLNERELLLRLCEYHQGDLAPDEHAAVTSRLRVDPEFKALSLEMAELLTLLKSAERPVSAQLEESLRRNVNAQLRLQAVELSTDVLISASLSGDISDRETDVLQKTLAASPQKARELTELKALDAVLKQAQLPVNEALSAKLFERMKAKLPEAAMRKPQPASAMVTVSRHDRPSLRVFSAQQANPWRGRAGWIGWAAVAAVALALGITTVLQLWGKHTDRPSELAAGTPPSNAGTDVSDATALNADAGASDPVIGSAKPALPPLKDLHEPENLASHATEVVEAPPLTGVNTIRPELPSSLKHSPKEIVSVTQPTPSMTPQIPPSGADPVVAHHNAANNNGASVGWTGNGGSNAGNGSPRSPTIPPTTGSNETASTPTDPEPTTPKTPTIPVRKVTSDDPTEVVPDPAKDLVQPVDGKAVVGAVLGSVEVRTPSNGTTAGLTEKMSTGKQLPSDSEVTTGDGEAVLVLPDNSRLYINRASNLKISLHGKKDLTVILNAGEITYRGTGTLTLTSGKIAVSNGKDVNVKILGNRLTVTVLDGSSKLAGTKNSVAVNANMLSSISLTGDDTVAKPTAISTPTATWLNDLKLPGDSATKNSRGLTKQKNLRSK